MVKRSNIEQLNDAIDAMMAQAPLPEVAPQIDLLVRLAADLRDLPDDEFRARLKAEIQTKALQINISKTSSEEKTMQKSAVAQPVREGFHTITPYLAVPEAADLVDFVKNAFRAVETMRATTPGGGIHAEVRIGDSMLMIGGGEALRGKPRNTALHLYVNDADSVYKRAIEAGAKSIYGPMNQEYGDREAGLSDLSGNEWYIATHLEPGKPVPEGLRSVTPFLHPKGAPQLIDFLKKAFGAEEVNKEQSPDGVIHHAIVRIGDSALEMGESHGQFQPLPAMFYLYVDDADSWYRRALEAGAISNSEPADQPYGDRTASVTDPFGNIWYLANRIQRDAVD
jgi:PhnB protein